MLKEYLCRYDKPSWHKSNTGAFKVKARDEDEARVKADNKLFPRRRKYPLAYKVYKVEEIT